MPEESQTSTQDQIEQRMAELPDDVREAVLSAELGEHIHAIGQKHSLHIDQIGALEDEAMLVMLGFFEPETFSNQIATQLQIPIADATTIAQEVNEQIFLPIRESMKAFADSKRAGVAKPIQNLPVAPAPAVPVQQGFARGPSVGNTPPALDPVPQVTVMPPKVNPDGFTNLPPAPMKEAEKMLTEPTVAKPIYKADPYREPIE